MRSRFEKQLLELNKSLIEMGALCEEAIEKVAKALITGDIELAQYVLTNSKSIDHMERDIERLCMTLLLHQQPVAKDLRMITSALRMIKDMERIGDQAEDIAELVILLKGQTIDSVNKIEKMANETAKMVRGSIDAFVNKNLYQARDVLKQDDIVDQLFVELKRDIINLISLNQYDGEFGLDILMIAKYLERIGDHATNIAEMVIYSLTGNSKFSIA
ncbi:MAG: phosphate signaling complex protein PhoU [Longicatena sp.]|nr:phosphate signaling complex protein PhoU [Longicatena sp.]